MSKRPAGLIYTEDDRPPFLTLILLGVQHIFLMSSTLVLPVVLVTEIGGSFEDVRTVVAMSMIACGVGTILQALRVRGVGSGYLCPNLCGPNFFAASMQAAWLGGLPLMKGMIIIAGLVEIVFARLIGRLRTLFPPEITGLVVLMVAESLIALGVSKFMGINYEGEPINSKCVLVAAITLFLMVSINVWSRGKLKLYSVLIGMACGYSLSYFLEIITSVQLGMVVKEPLIALPATSGMLSFSFKWSLLPTFIIVSITGALKSFGNLIMCEKINDDEWVEPDMKRVGNGLVADSLCVIISGLLGAMASDTSASNVALSNASGATSRRIAYAAGIIFILLGFSPKVGALLSVMPMPVMGAILVYVASFMIISSMQIIIGSGIDTRKIFVIAIPLIFGLSMDILPSLFSGIPYYLRPLFDSPLTLCTILAVILHQLFRLRA